MLLYDFIILLKKDMSARQNKCGRVDYHFIIVSTSTDYKYNKLIRKTSKLFPELSYHIDCDCLPNNTAISTTELKDLFESELISTTKNTIRGVYKDIKDKQHTNHNDNFIPKSIYLNATSTLRDYKPDSGILYKLSEIPFLHWFITTPIQPIDLVTDVTRYIVFQHRDDFLAYIHSRNYQQFLTDIPTGEYIVLDQEISTNNMKAFEIEF